jgi:hypothetical protein
MKPRISSKGILLLRSTAASKSLMKALMLNINRSKFMNGQDIDFTIKVKGKPIEVKVNKTLTLSDTSIKSK